LKKRGLKSKITQMMRNRISLLVLCILLIIIASCNENQSSKYASYDEFINSKGVQNGWIPIIIPKDSKNIIEVHNIDNNNTFGCFEYVNSKSIELLFDSGKIQQSDSIIVLLNSINQPKQPSWFISQEQIITMKPIILKQTEFVFILDTIRHKGFFFR